MATILIADDHALLRSSLVRIFTSSGHRVLQADDGQVALEQVAQVCPDVLLLDIRMPRLGGLEVLQEIRTRGLPIAVVVMSAEAGGVQGRSMTAAKALGADALLAKPFGLDEILGVLEGLVDVGDQAS